MTWEIIFVTNWTKIIVTKSKDAHVFLQSDWARVVLLSPDWLAYVSMATLSDKCLTDHVL